MIKFIGNCSDIIDWNTIVESLNEQSPAYIGPRHKGNDDIIGIQEISKAWNDAGYTLAINGGSAGWGMYFAGQHFDHSVVEKFASFVGINPINSWISKISPGMMAPWHWDANDAEEEYSKMPDMIRVSCHVSQPAPGHISIIENKCLHNQAQGNTYQWPSRKSWHAGANCGLVPKYLFNMFGHKL
jgi:hypothetical protein